MINEIDGSPMRDQGGNAYEYFVHDSDFSEYLPEMMYSDADFWHSEIGDIVSIYASQRVFINF